MILFLDFDGVLHPEDRDAEPFCRVPLLWQLLRQCPQAEVVFSTSWREVYPPDVMLDFVTAGGGEDLAHRFVGSNPRVLEPSTQGDYRRREIECLAWLAGSGFASRPWLALDDIADWFSTSSPNLHLVDYRTGLTEQDVAAVLQKLKQW